MCFRCLYIFYRPWLWLCAASCAAASPYIRGGSLNLQGPTGLDKVSGPLEVQHATSIWKVFGYSFPKLLGAQGTEPSGSLRFTCSGQGVPSLSKRSAQHHFGTSRDLAFQSFWKHKRRSTQGTLRPCLDLAFRSFWKHQKCSTRGTVRSHSALQSLHSPPDHSLSGGGPPFNIQFNIY